MRRASLTLLAPPTLRTSWYTQAPLRMYSVFEYILHCGDTSIGNPRCLLYFARSSEGQEKKGLTCTWGRRNFGVNQEAGAWKLLRKRLKRRE